MDWGAPVDIYCERISPAFWSEPVNALSNISFVLAASVTIYTLRHLGRKPTPMDTALITLCAAIGVGSFLFHTFANRWSEWADTLPIWSFVGLYLFATLTQDPAKSTRFKTIAGSLISAGVAGILLLSANGEAATTNAVDPLNGSGQYAPALIALIVVTVITWRKKHPQRAYFAAATLAFAVSLALRTIDIALCTQWPIGTHFLWHLFNGVMLALLLQAYVRRDSFPTQT
jgi:hypothetical protein